MGVEKEIFTRHRQKLFDSLNRDDWTMWNTFHFNGNLIRKDRFACVRAVLGCVCVCVRAECVSVIRPMRQTDRVRSV